METKSPKKSSGGRATSGEKGKKVGQPYRRYDEAFKLKVLDDMVATNATFKEISVRYGISKSNVRYRSRIFGVPEPIKVKNKALEENATDLQKDYLQLQKEHERLKLEMRRLKMRNLVLETENEMISEKYHLKKRPI